MRYVALLRGVNVGGNSLITMAELRECIAALGHADVRTYIASGNVLFSSRERSGATLDAQLERAIAERFGLPVRVVVRSAAEITRIAAAVPPAWIGADDLRVMVAFLLRGNDARVVARLLSPRNGVDELRTAAGALLWATRRDALARTGLRLAGTAVYKQ